MRSSLIGKLEKAKRYAQEPQRIRLTQLSCTFQGDHDLYQLSFDQGKWQCTCTFFSNQGVCSHTLTLERLLGEMLPRTGQASDSVAQD